MMAYVYAMERLVILLFRCALCTQMRSHHTSLNLSRLANATADSDVTGTTGTSRTVSVSLYEYYRVITTRYPVIQHEDVAVFPLRIDLYESKECSTPP